MELGQVRLLQDRTQPGRRGAFHTRSARHRPRLDGFFFAAFFFVILLKSQVKAFHTAEEKSHFGFCPTVLFSRWLECQPRTRVYPLGEESSARPSRRGSEGIL